MDVSPRIELVIGPMYAGKTSELMRRVRRFTHAKKRCLMIKYKMDTRYSDECVASHDKQLMVAVPASRLEDVLPSTHSFDVIAIDEAQFFPDVVEVAELLANSGKVVLMAALDADFRRKPFGRVLELIPLAESVLKLTAVCTTCYGEAAFTKRTVASTAIELIGGAESYAPVCRRCYEQHVSAQAAMEARAATPTLVKPDTRSASRCGSATSDEAADPASVCVSPDSHGSKSSEPLAEPLPQPVF